MSHFASAEVPKPTLGPAALEAAAFHKGQTTPKSPKWCSAERLGLRV